MVWRKQLDFSFASCIFDPIKEFMISLNSEQFEAFYAAHKDMIYGIVSEISHSQIEREQLFTNTFVEASRLNLSAQKYPNPCISLIRLVLRFACANLNQFSGQLELGKQAFFASPFLNKLVMVEIEKFSILDGKVLTRTQVNKDLRDEFILLRNRRNSESAVSNNEHTKRFATNSR